MRDRCLSPVAVLTALLLFAPPALADTVFVTSLDGTLTCPPTATAATGTGTFTLNAAETQLTIHIEFSGLQGTQTNQHIHNAPSPSCGPVAFGLPGGGSPIDAVWAIPPAMVTELKAGRLYVNIHTTFRSSGEIRGQIVSGPTPIGSGTWGRLKQLYR